MLLGKLFAVLGYFWVYVWKPVQHLQLILCSILRLCTPNAKQMYMALYRSIQIVDKLPTFQQHMIVYNVPVTDVTVDKVYSQTVGVNITQTQQATTGIIGIGTATSVYKLPIVLQPSSCVLTVSTHVSKGILIPGIDFFIRDNCIYLTHNPAYTQQSDNYYGIQRRLCLVQDKLVQCYIIVVNYCSVIPDQANYSAILGKKYVAGNQHQVQQALWQLSMKGATPFNIAQYFGAAMGCPVCCKQQTVLSVFRKYNMTYVQTQTVLYKSRFSAAVLPGADIKPGQRIFNGYFTGTRKFNKIWQIFPTVYSIQVHTPFGYLFAKNQNSVAVQAGLLPLYCATGQEAVKQKYDQAYKNAVQQSTVNPFMYTVDNILKDNMLIITVPAVMDQKDRQILSLLVRSIPLSVLIYSISVVQQQTANGACICINNQQTCDILTR